MDSKLQIILLEDNPADAELVRRELRKAGLPFAVEWARDKASFAKAVKTVVPDLVLADFAIPGFDGLAAMELAREHHPQLPVIIVSGAIGEETAIEALKAGATDYVLKDRLGRLGPVVKRAIDEARRLAEKQRAEEELARGRETLRESEEQLRLLLEGVRDYAIFMLDAKGCVANWASGAQRMKQWTAGEIIGQHVSVFYLPEDIASGKPQRALEVAAKEGRYEEEGRRRRKDGTVFWAQVTITPVYDAGGRLRGFAKVMRDISDRKRAEEALAAAKLSAERAKMEAEAANKAKDHFLAVLSHELRTPLTPALATVSMLQEDHRLDAETQEHLEMIRRNIDLEARLIDDLLDVTRIEQGKVELERRPTQLCNIIRCAVEVCMPDIEARQLELVVDTPDGTYLVDADSGRLQQVFWNLLKNAIKFTAHGGCVGISCHRDGANVVVQVNDSGEGIDPAVLPRIFNPFEQEGKHITRQFGGLGLGLAICKAIVELHGGTISAASAGKGKGASFSVRLPLCRPETLGEAPDTCPSDVVQASAKRALTILLVEDHGDTARIVKRLLTASGHDVQTAGDVATALELAGSRPFDLLISDLGLPDGSGVDLMRELRRQGNSLRGIALSGYGQEEDVRRSKEAGFEAHITKPANPARLAHAIASLTSQSSSHQTT